MPQLLADGLRERGVAVKLSPCGGDQGIERLDRLAHFGSDSIEGDGGTPDRTFDDAFQRGAFGGRRIRSRPLVDGGNCGWCRCARL